MEFAIEWHDRMGSTNAGMRDRFMEGPELASGLVIAAREQTAGRGRQERKWLSQPDTNLCFSLFIETSAELAEVPSLTMATALAITDMLNALRIPAVPKWPNDVLVRNKKICGILSERVETPFAKASSSEATADKSEVKRSGIIIGIGLNVNMTSEEADAIDRPATSMLIETGTAHDLNQILESLFPQMEYWIGKWENGGFTVIREAWTQKAGPIGKSLSVHDGNIKKKGTLVGFGDHGELLLQTTNGIETIWSGDVS